MGGRGGRAVQQPAVTSSGSDDGPLAWNVAGLLADDPGADRVFEVDGVTIDLGEDLAARRSRSTARSASCGRTAGSWPTPTCATALALECSRCLRDIELPGRDPVPGGVPAGARPDDRPAAAGRRRAGRRPPDRPPRARPRDAGPRGDPAGRADRAAVPPGLPGPVHRLRRAPRRGRARPPRRRHRSAPGGAARLHGRTTPDRGDRFALHSAVGPTTSARGPRTPEQPASTSPSRR